MQIASSGPIGSRCSSLSSRHMLPRQTSFACKYVNFSSQHVVQYDFKSKPGNTGCNGFLQFSSPTLSALLPHHSILPLSPASSRVFFFKPFLGGRSASYVPSIPISELHRELSSRAQEAAWPRHSPSARDVHQAGGESRLFGRRVRPSGAATASGGAGRRTG